MKKKKSPAVLGQPKSSKRLYSNAAASQRARIIKHFEEQSPRLSTIQARNQYGILHPSGRMMELRRKGFKIDTHWISEPDTNGVFHRVGLYVYQGKQEMPYESQ